jgi:hypothetical protein
VFNWRDHLDVHPAADLFPLMSESELKELAEDIRKTGLQAPILLHRSNTRTVSVADGRNRLDALADLGWLGPQRETDEYDPDPLSIIIPYDAFVGSMVGGTIASSKQFEFTDSFVLDDHVLPMIVSLNLHRRHLTPEQKRDLIAKVLKAKPETSNRQIGAITKSEKKKVAAVRTELESTGVISPVEKTTGKDGKARKQRKKPSPEQVHERSKRQAEKKRAAIKATLTTLNGQAVETADLGPAAQEQLTKDAEASAEARKVENAALDAPPIAPAEQSAEVEWSRPNHPRNASGMLKLFLNACYSFVVHLEEVELTKAEEAFKQSAKEAKRRSEKRKTDPPKAQASA